MLPTLMVELQHATVEPLFRERLAGKKYRKLSVHEVHRHGEETYSKKSRLEEIILDPPKPDSAQQENFSQCLSCCAS